MESKTVGWLLVCREQHRWDADPAENQTSTGLGSRVVWTVSVIEFQLIYSAFDLKKILLLKMITEAWMSQLTPLGNYISLPLLRYLFLW